MWDKAQAKGGNATDVFVNIAEDTGDKIWNEIWGLMPREAKEHAAQVFGDKGVFMVRKDLIENVGGYRQPSLADIWTDKSRINPEVNQAIRNFLIGIGGKETYKVMSSAIKEWQGLIQLAKNAITVLSVVVPVSNIASNMGQLMARRVGPRDIAKGMSTKLVEVNQYRRNEERRVEIQADLAANQGQTGVLRRLQAELKGLEDSNKRMSIWPMIEAGEFTTIASEIIGSALS